MEYSHLADDNKTDEPTEESPSEFSKLVAGLDTSTSKAGDEEATDELAETSEETSTEVDEEESTETDDSSQDEAEEKATVTEGPTAAMKTLARQNKIPDVLIEWAVNDDQLAGLIELASQSAEPDMSESPDIPTFEIDLPEDEYPANDPVRGVLSRMQSHFTEQLTAAQRKIGELEKLSKTTEQQQRQAVEQQARSFQAEFDRTLDRLNEAAFGQSSKLSSPAIRARTVMFDTVREILAEDSGVPLPDAVRKAAEMLNFNLTNKAPDEKAAIRKQAQKKLGSGSAKPAEPLAKSPERMMREFLVSIGAKD